MAQIIIKLSLSNAIKTGSLQHGTMPLTITSWDGWSDEERAVLADMCRNNSERHPLELPAATTEALHVLAKKKLEEILAEQERTKTKELETIEKVKKEGIDSLLSNRKVTEYCKTCGSNIRLFGFSFERDDWYPDYDYGAVIPKNIRDLARSECEKRNKAARKIAAETLREHGVECREKKAARKAEKEQKEADKEAEWKKLAHLTLSQEQKERQDAGYLGESEISGTIRDFFFSGVENPRYERMDESDIEHDDTCYQETDSGTFDVTNMSELTSTQYAEMQTLKKAVQTDVGTLATVDIVPRLHKGYCDQCDGGTTYRYGLLAILNFPAENRITREFSMVSDEEE